MHAPFQAVSAAQPIPRALGRGFLPSLRRRPCRVILLGTAIAAMSVVDFYLTLLYLTHTGMSEANPVARAIIAYQSPAVLGLWKALTVSLCVGILYLIRERRSAELGAWVGAMVLGWLMIHWGRYVDYKQQVSPEFFLVGAEIDPAYVRMGHAVP